MIQFCLYTGFGGSKQTYDRTIANPNQGYGQISGTVPPGYVVLGSLLVNIYRWNGHGSKLTSSYMMRVFLLATAVSIDGMDLMHLAPVDTTQDTCITQQVQHTTPDWDRLAHVLAHC